MVISYYNANMVVYGFFGHCFSGTHILLALLHKHVLNRDEAKTNINFITIFIEFVIGISQTLVLIKIARP